ncbi:MAG: SigE family RNA polymerase sigma factor [Tetrasphaera sp.]
MDTDFGQFAGSAWPRLYRSMYAVARDRQAAEDAVQSALIKTQLNWDRVCDAEEPLAYVRRIALNTLLAERRRPWARREITIPNHDLMPSGSVPAAQDGVPARIGVLDAIRALPPRQRAIIVLRYYDDLSESQIADALGCRPSTVKSQAAAALATLRRTLGAIDLAEENQ